MYVCMYVLHTEILSLFLGDWLQLTALLLRALLPAIFQTEKVLDQAFLLLLNDTILLIK